MTSQFIVLVFGGLSDEIELQIPPSPTYCSIESCGKLQTRPVKSSM